MSDDTPKYCPKCGSDDWKPNPKYWEGKEKYYCPNCLKHFDRPSLSRGKLWGK